MRWFSRRRSGWEAGRSRAELRMIRRMEKKGGKGFRVLRSAEVGMKHYTRPRLDEPEATP